MHTTCVTEVVHLFLSNISMKSLLYIDKMFIILYKLDIMYTNHITAPCSSLTDPNNGMITCSLGDDGVPSYEDICSFTCNTGYELTGSDTRTCRSDGNWSGSEAMCIRG